MNPRARTRRKAARRFFGYDAAAEHSMRRQPAAHERSEDDELPPDKRRKVVSRARNARRNQEIAAWAIRKHLDFTSDFRFRSSTGVKAFDYEVNAFVDWWSLAENCDATGRFSLRRLVRMIEALRVIDGDELVVTGSDSRRPHAPSLGSSASVRPIRRNRSPPWKQRGGAWPPLSPSP